MGIDSYHLSSSDPIKLLHKLESIFKNNLKPIFIEVDTYRYLEHCGPNNDDNLNYRPKKEVNYWTKRDPLLLTENYILKNKISTIKKINLIKKKVNQSIKEAFKFAEKSKYPIYEKFLKLI